MKSDRPYHKTSYPKNKEWRTAANEIRTDSLRRDTKKPPPEPLRLDDE